MYLLAKNPDIQEQLYQEVMSASPGDKVPDSDDIAKMPYLKAVIRETLRSEETLLLPEFCIYSVYFSLSRKEPHSLI